jgi:NADH-quinone oxidoreductase subunit A
VFRRWVDQGRGVFALLEVLVFVVILLVGLVYVWVKGDLEWIRSIKGDPRGIQNVVTKTAPALPPPTANDTPPRAAAMAARPVTQEG